MEKRSALIQRLDASALYGCMDAAALDVSVRQIDCSVGRVSAADRLQRWT